MVSRDYTKELGLKSATPRVPWSVAVVLLAAMVVGTWYGVTKLRALPSARHQANDMPATKAPASVAQAPE